MATDAFFLSTGPEPAGAQNRWKTLKSDPARVEKFLRAELESRVVLRPRLGVNGAKGAVAAVVGPTGSGKTTSLAKLAVAASAQRPVRLVSLDQSLAFRSAAALEFARDFRDHLLVRRFAREPAEAGRGRAQERVRADRYTRLQPSGTACRREAGRRAGRLRRRRCAPGGAGLYESPRSAKFHRAVSPLPTFQATGHQNGRNGNASAPYSRRRPWRGWPSLSCRTDPASLTIFAQPRERICWRWCGSGRAPGIRQRKVTNGQSQHTLVLRAGRQSRRANGSGSFWSICPRCAGWPRGFTRSFRTPPASKT